MAEITPGLSIGQVAERTGLSVHALRFYEREQIFAGPVQRGPGGHRVYTEQDVDWLVFCTRLRASGMPLPAIRGYAELVRRGAGNELDRLAVLRQHRADVRRQIDALTECLALINRKVQMYEDSLAQGRAEPDWHRPVEPTATNDRPTVDDQPAVRSGS
ncbi:MerR family transcriptional regulator [Micromonospora polyrhachis]|uniref:DNA-binding transcriptional MerR regulator n=1 Tax=Micromonospora polyrhachis TaxID=1282883 RepID=A0A7W7SRM6_9ACTN|nr:MerR family transcriptional regulator [Micromonospora polyrhachis]MBB4959708.1 DNA-binding transcriptional MerR regulator [Micromonospora polyrhachis]